MKAIPMLFQTELVRALLDGRKTVTRRPVTPQPPEWCDEFGYTTFTPERHISGRGRYKDQGPAEKFIKQPVFKGDLIWVRETFMPDPDADHDAWSEHELSYFEWAGCDSSPQFLPNALKTTEHCLYKANGPIDGKWTPSIHMPRWANRLTLKVTDVRIERVQNLTEEQAVREGMPTDEECQRIAVDSGIVWYQKPVVWFKNAWNSIYGDWDENPYVWVIEFEVIHQNIDKYISSTEVTV